MTRRSIKWLALVAIVALLALRIHFWGAPIRPLYQIVSAPQATPSAGEEWTIAPANSPTERWTARDVDGDGTWDQFTTPQGAFLRPGALSGASASTSTSAATAAAPRRWLVVCLDGVPLPVMRALWDEGEFREFFRPTAIVSTMPSDTEMALTEALHAAPVPGYEHSYFDREKNAISGGPWVTLSGRGIPYIKKLDYDPPGWAKALPYLMVQKTYSADVGRLRAAFLRSHAPVFIAHIAASDALMHVRTAEQARPLLLEFDNAMREIYLDARGDLGIIVFSDHGNTQTFSRAVPIEAFLGAHGWQIKSSIDAARDVAIPSYGLVGFAAVYCRPESVDQLAEDLRGVEGADVIISVDNDSNLATIRAAGSQGIAKLEWSADGQHYRYTATDGDPLQLTKIFDSFRTAGKLDQQGFAADADLYAATVSALYPDAAARIRDWATAGVQNRANIMVSLRPGYFHGSGAFQRLVNLASTHGGLEQSGTLGFAMATFPLPASTRVRDIIPTQLLDSASASVPK